MITPLLGYTPDPLSRSFDRNVRYAYHSDVQGHSTEDCRALKRQIEKMIQDKSIMDTRHARLPSAAGFVKKLHDLAVHKRGYVDLHEMTKEDPLLCHYGSNFPKVVDMGELGISEAFKVKQAVLLSATEAAEMILRLMKSSHVPHGGGKIECKTGLDVFNLLRCLYSVT
ncbi:hypothetical protein CQW23_15985 [Capsicum baccatum]|uniref:Uncharacterized protein n=1 Tax=Capsicum baccatum TaxID=33114 RepID=A0A2G2WNK8_CAPBA|nr:hypothetical protein CQW23_15985 [Capsicum baccatum]